MPPRTWFPEVLTGSRIVLRRHVPENVAWFRKWYADPEIARLARGEHHDPHAVLGAHQSEGGTVIRSFHPDASAAELLAPGASPGGSVSEPVPSPFQIGRASVAKTCGVSSRKTFRR